MLCVQLGSDSFLVPRRVVVCLGSSGCFFVEVGRLLRFVSWVALLVALLLGSLWNVAYRSVKICRSVPVTEVLVGEVS